MNRGMGTPQKDDDGKAEQGRATKSGRKVKRPAHFDDSPDSKKTGASYAASVEDVRSPKVQSIPEAAKKSARKTILKSVDDVPSKNGGLKPEEAKSSARKTLKSVDDTPIKNGEEKPVLAKQSARKTLLIEGPEEVKKSSRKTIHAHAKDESPEPEASKKSARKALLKSAVKNSSIEQELKTPKKKSEPDSPALKKTVNKVEHEMDPLDIGVSRTGRKIKVPAHLKEFEDVVVASPKKEAPEKFSSRKSMAPSRKIDSEADDTPKTPARGRSLAAPRKDSDNDPEKEKSPTVAPRKSTPTIVQEAEEKCIPKTPGRGRPQVASRKDESAPSVRTNALEVEEKVTTKTPGRGRSLALSRKDRDADPEEERVATKTPSRRGISTTVALKSEDLIDPLANVAKTEDLPSKTPSKKTALSTATRDASPKSVKELIKNKRGKSLAPEESKSSPSEEKLSTKTPSKRGKSLAPIRNSPDLVPKTPKLAKVVEDSMEPISRSGRKIKPKKFYGEFEEEDPLPFIPKVCSPVKPAALKPSSVEKKESPQKKVSPVKRVTSSVQEPLKSDASPPKKTKLNPQPNTSTKVSKISPNTEERQITIRGANDHHHGIKDVAVVIEQDPLAVSSEESLVTSSVESTSANISVKDNNDDVSTVATPEQKEQKSKRGRKTLPAPTVMVEEQLPKAPKTPTSRRMTVIAVAPVQTEDVGSSRSGRKIKPKKFFGEEEVASIPVLKTDEGRGKRKTLALESTVVEKPKNEPASEERIEENKKTAQEISSREEVFSTVSAVEASVAIESQKNTGNEKAVVSTEQAEEKSASKTEESVNGHLQEDKNSLERPRQLDNAQYQEDDEQPDPLEYDLMQLESDDSPLNGNFQGIRIEQTSPAHHLMEKAPPNDLAPLAEEPAVMEGLIEEPPVMDRIAEKPAVAEESAVMGELAEEPVVDEPAVAIESAMEEPMTTDGQAMAAVVEELSVADESAETEASAEMVEPAAVEEPAVAEQTTVAEGLAEEPAVVDELMVDENINKERESQSINETLHMEFETDSVVPEELLASSEPIQEESGEKTVVLEEIMPIEEDQRIQEETQALETLNEIAHVEDEIQQVSEPAVVEVEPPVEVLDADLTLDSEVHTINRSEQEEINNPEISTNSSLSEALIVEDEALAPQTLVVEEESAVPNESKEQFEGLEFLEESTEQILPKDPVHEENDVQPDEEVSEENQGIANEPSEMLNKSDLEDDLDSTKPPNMDDFGFDEEQEQSVDAPEPTTDSFAENDRDNESVMVIPDAPIERKLDTSAPATPKTPDSKSNNTDENFSPDKPDAQQQAGVPQVIEIFDSPIATTFKLEVSETTGGSATSTPLEASAKLTDRERLIQNSRKRSLSASDAEVCKKNVTFHSPANSTILVDTIDERLKKNVKNESAKKPGINSRKRSLSEHKELGEVFGDGVKPAKITKLPNFKNIHQQHFKRMESIEEFHNRKVQRAKILVNSGSKSPAAASITKIDPQKSDLAMSNNLLRKSPYKTGNGTTSHVQQPSSGSKSLITRPMASGIKPLSDADRLAKRQKQFQAAFKPKIATPGDSSGTPGRNTPDGTRRVVEQSRHKQSQILKGVRTNKRFELLMKFRDAQE
ncbi:titin-like isoform X2 [Topomyia yanbarensis]|uniref:titin-like isoform X2 n=1 Tax=Topomyia yanbarensis TaxID=2498891 RepID=UPI00273B33F9|nr:titin-like isoform X2 [Topomyia yanbarensis]